MSYLRSVSVTAGLLFAAAVGAAPALLKDGLLVAAPDQVSLHAAPLESLDAATVATDYPDTTSLLVYKDDRLVFERYFGAGGINLLNDTRSATETLTALVVGQALAEGALQTAEQPVFTLLPDLAPVRNDGDAKQSITLMDLLTMSSALDCNDSDEHSPGNAKNMYPLANWSRWVADLPTRPDYLRAPGGRGPFAYCTGGVLLLGQIVQRATRMPLDQYFDQRLLRPLGINQRTWTRSPGGEFQAGGGLRLRSRDLLKLGILIRDSGRWNQRQLVPSSWVRRMQTVSNVVDEQMSYGMLMWQRQYASPCGIVNGWYMSGDGGSVVLVSAVKSLVAVITRTHFRQKDMHEQTARLLEQHVFAALPCTR